MPGKKRIHEEREVYNRLLTLIFTCKDLYSRNNVNNALTKVTPDPAFVSVLRDLTFGRFDNFFDLYDSVNKVLVDPSSTTEMKIDACNEFFDEAETIPELIAYMGSLFLDMPEDVAAKVDEVYYKNLDEFKKSGGVENQFTDLFIYLLTIGALPTSKYAPVPPDVDARTILNLESPEIGPRVNNLDVDHLTPITITVQTPKVSPPSKPAITPEETPSSYFEEDAEIISSRILSHCSNTLKSLGYSISQIESGLPIDKIADDIKEASKKIVDFRSTATSLIDYIDCDVDLKPYLYSKSGEPLKGISLYNSIYAFIQKFVSCVGSSGGNPEKFKECMGGKKEKSEEVVQEEAESTYKSNVEYYTVEGVNDILTKVGQPPLESYDQVKDFLTYIANLMKQYGVSTTDYKKLSTVFQVKKSEIDELLSKVPEPQRKELVSIVTSITKLPEPAMKVAVTTLDKIVQVGSQLKDNQAYYDTMLKLLNNAFSLSNNVTVSLTRLNSFLSYLNKTVTDEEKREKIITMLAENPDYVIQSVTTLLQPPKPKEEEKKKEEVQPEEEIPVETEEQNVIATRDDLVGLIMKLKNKFRIQEVSKVIPGFGEVYGIPAGVFYFSDTENVADLSSGTPYIIAGDELYTIDTSTDFGLTLANELNQKVYAIRSMKRVNIIGTNIIFFYVTKSLWRSDVQGRIFIFTSKEYDWTAPYYLIFDKDTLPPTYYDDLFIDRLDVDDIHVLADRATHIDRIIVISAQENLMRNRIYKIQRTPSGIEFIEWGEKK